MTPAPVSEAEVRLEIAGASLAGTLVVPGDPVALVLFAHGSGSSRRSPRNRAVAEVLQQAGMATLLFDLLTAVEEQDRANVFDVELLGGRVLAVIGWVRQQSALAALPVCLFGASTGAAAALWAAAEPGSDVAAVVSRGGRADLAGERLTVVRSPTCLIVGSRDEVVLDLNRSALARLRCEAELVVVPGATHLFEEPGTLATAATAARDFLLAHLPPPTPLL